MKKKKTTDIHYTMDEFQKPDIQWKEPEMETTYHMITLVRNVQERQICRDGK